MVKSPEMLAMESKLNYLTRTCDRLADRLTQVEQQLQQPRTGKKIKAEVSE